MQIIYFDHWKISDVRTRPDHLFIFGDNDIECGKGGQAIIRDEPNAMGIPTKKYPTMRNNAFYSDNEYEDNQKKIDNAIELILNALSKYKVLVLPKDGFGTGLAKLPEKAPKTFQYLEKRVDDLILATNPDQSNVSYLTINSHFDSR